MKELRKMYNQKTKKMENFIANLSSEDRIELFLIIISFTEENKLGELFEKAKDYLDVMSIAFDIEIYETDNSNEIDSDF